MFSFFFPFAHRLSYTPSGILYVQCRYSCFFSLISSSSFSHLIGLIRIVYNNKLKNIYFLTTALGIPIDIVPTSKSCVFCRHRNGIPFFPHLTVSWSLPFARIIFFTVNKKVSCMYQGSGEESVLRLLWLYEPAIL